MAPTKVMDHTEYQKKVKKYDDDTLRYIIKECKEVIDRQKDFNPNCGYYADEICYCSMELKRREDLKKGKKGNGKKGDNEDRNKGMGQTPEEIR